MNAITQRANPTAFTSSDRISWIFEPGRAPAASKSASLVVCIQTDQSPISFRQDRLDKEMNWLRIVMRDDDISTENPDSADPLTDVVAQSHAVIEHLRRRFAQPVRVYVAGVTLGAAVAFRLMMESRSICGIALIDGDLDAVPLSREWPLRGTCRQALLVTTIERGAATIRNRIRFGRLLHATGMRITTRIYSSRDSIQQALFTDVAKWIRGDFCLHQEVDHGLPLSRNLPNYR